MHLHPSFSLVNLYKSIIVTWILIFSLCINNIHSYYFWLKSFDNSAENIQSIEQTLNISLPVISFIFDPRESSDVLNSIDRIVDILWTGRIYHFTVSPNNFSADDVVLWKFDSQYKAFFQKIKEKNIHVIFRTMHEMNGGRYPRSSNPEKFKAARIHVWTLSRLVGLWEENIAFDFSINHRDMPTKWTPSQSAILIKCTLWKKDCYHFEDYYPGDEFVDVIWFTFYNWWKANSNRQRLSPVQILYDKNRNTYERIKNFNKPIIIDEVATTSVRYDWNYNFDKSRSEYLTHNERKNFRLYQLREFLINHPEIVAVSYFNTDYTHWLNFNVVWEADRAIINMDNNKVYEWFRDLELFWEKNLNNILTSLFHLTQIKIEWSNVLIPKKCNKEIDTIASIINKKTTDTQQKIELIQTLQNSNIKSECISLSLNILYEIYNKAVTISIDK